MSKEIKALFHPSLHPGNPNYCDGCGYPLETAAEFYRWLMKHDAHIAKTTEERIIKLLKDPDTMNRWFAQWDKNLGVYGNLRDYFIALIQGEQPADE